jgi:hypothetical protein
MEAKSKKIKESTEINNTLSALPEVIDKDMGWFLMFGQKDENTTRVSTNYDAVMSVPRLR